MNWVMFLSMYCQALSTSIVFNQKLSKAKLRNWASRQTFLFECDQSMLWLPIVEHSVRAFLKYTFKKRFIKNISRTGLNFNRATV